MRRYLIAVTVVVMVIPFGEAALGQQRMGGTTANQGFQVGQNTGGGQGQSGNFGVGTAGQVDTNARYMRDNRQGAFVGPRATPALWAARQRVGRTRTGIYGAAAGVERTSTRAVEVDRKTRSGLFCGLGSRLPSEA